jgi:hypothetical protein
VVSFCNFINTGTREKSPVPFGADLSDLHRSSGGLMRSRKKIAVKRKEPQYFAKAERQASSFLILKILYVTA